MMRQYELVEKVNGYKKNADEALLNKAYIYAMQKHGQQKRANGDPYFSHPLEVAAILTDLRLDEETIATALLHDTIEDTDATRKEIDALFGEKIGFLVEGLTKLKRLDLVSKKAEQAENLRRLLLAISDDVRVLLVKLADRLHNMRTLDHMPAEKRSRIAAETMEIYAPLAGRIGMQGMREELEELAFRHVNPSAHAMVTAKLAELVEKNRNLVSTITSELASKLEREGIQATVKSRQKRAFSVFRKMENKRLSLEQLSDLFGFRIIVGTLEDCYRTLGVVHTTWQMVPARFKDFISTPKQNDYRSLHTTVIGPSRQRVELQIRTWEMHEVAEFGIAAHTLYKDGFAPDGNGSEKMNAFATLRKTIAQLAEGVNPEEFLEHTKLELFLDQVFCFTPKGRIIALPKGATPIDFAYAVHTDVGNTCVGCKINGQIMPVITELKNGDEVEIIRSKAQTPPAAWESVVVTGKARASIRRATREAVRKQYAGLGTRILERAFARAGKTFASEMLAGALPRLAREAVDDVLADVGRGELASVDVIRAVFPDYKDERVSHAMPDKDEGWFGLKAGSSMLFRVPGSRAKGKRKQGETPAIPIRGASGDLPVRFSPDGGAVPGDRIVGILTPRKGITIFPIQSPELKEYDEMPERWLDVRWDIEEGSSERFPARIKVVAINEPGTLATIAEVMANNDANIQNLAMHRTAPDFMDMVFDIEVWDLNHLTRIIRQLAAKPVVSKAERIVGRESE
ncbi:MAG: bifunctional (p)ppGpp synthetase/guanosine-3',5'-bis(diphosphate) 3'-pyrophosphohydrolase [Nitratireductor sp.]|nr:bifunctional (p)ppGpp synthetase/guanosine-3',5'-bis(diphosphate) 3'-pyrophosphohydrolase [Nitratireductor sp.]